MLPRPHFLTICDPWTKEGGFQGNCTEVKTCPPGNLGEDEALSDEGSGSASAPGYQHCTDTTLYRFTGDELEDDVICGSLFNDKGNETLAKV